MRLQKAQISALGGFGLALLFFLPVFVLPTAAAALTWTLVDIMFDDGGVATGTFDYNPDAGGLGNFNISVSGGNEAVFPAFVYTPSNALSSIASGLNTRFTIDIGAPGGTPDSRSFLLITSEPKTNLGGSLALDFAAQPRECFNCNPFRLVSSGSIFAVPEPGSLGLVALGLAAIGVSRRRHDRG